MFVLYVAAAAVLALALGIIRLRAQARHRVQTAAVNTEAQGALNRIAGLCVTDVPARRAAGDRGVSLAEYALIVSLIAVLTLAAVNSLGGSTSRALSSRGGQIGNGDFVIATTVPDGGSDATTTPAATTTAAPTTVAPTTAAAPAITASRSRIDSRTVSVTFTVAPPAAGVVIRGNAVGGSQSASWSCTTDSSGRCTATIGNLQSNKAATVTTTSVTATPVWTGTTPGPTTIP